MLVLIFCCFVVSTELFYQSLFSQSFIDYVVSDFLNYSEHLPTYAFAYLLEYFQKDKF